MQNKIPNSIMFEYIYADQLLYSVLTADPTLKDNKIIYCTKGRLHSVYIKVVV